MKKIIMLMMAAFTILSVSAFAQEKAGKKDTLKHAAFYTCPMHKDVVSAEPGECPKCGMKLEISKKEQMKMKVTKTYNCPTHLDVVSDKAGKCPKCGNDLLKSKKEQMKEKVMNKYSCPMHGDITSDTPGKCSKCGMDMKEKKAVTEKKNDK